MVEVDIPEVRAELEAAFAAYEAALLANDIETLNRLFWESPLTLRYGVRELQYSHREIADFRRERGAIDQRRTLRIPESPRSGAILASRIANTCRRRQAASAAKARSGS